MFRTASFIGALALLAVLCAASVDEPVSFNRDIRPVLSDNCYACHGPDPKKRQFGLRLDTPEGPFQDRVYGGPVIVPGRPDESELYRRITAESPAKRMPARSSGKELTADQIEAIRRWIEQGANYQKHWSFVPPRRPAPPSVGDRSWPRNPVDAFVLAKLERAGLHPSPEAEKTTLIRRVTLDLTGLPPTPAEVDAFLADDSSKAFEKVVDRLLRSPRYGERMAAKWLDIARYADTHGYHIDSHRDMWHWRDWVIDAYNRNLPFDRFTVEQLAGDLLPDVTLQQKIATGFNRNHMINYEGGAIPEEYRTAYVIDRVNTTATAWLGLTMGCAQCHDHKYDPITQREFYEFFAFFNTISEKGLDGRKGNAEPVVQIPSPVQARELEDVKARMSAVGKVLPEEEIKELLDDWSRTARSRLPLPPRQGLAAHYEFDGNLADTSGNYRHAAASSDYLTFKEGKAGQSANLDGETHLELGADFPIERDDPFSIALWVRPGPLKENSLLSRMDEARGWRGYEVFFRDAEVLPGTIVFASNACLRLVETWPDKALVVCTEEKLRHGRFHHLTVLSTGSGDGSGVRLYLDGEAARTTTLQDTLSGSIVVEAPLYAARKTTGEPFSGRIEDLRFYRRALKPDEVLQLAEVQPVRDILRIRPKQRTEAQQNLLRDCYLENEARRPLREAHLELKALKQREQKLNDEIPTTMVMAEVEEPRDTFILRRGSYAEPDEKVTPGVPSVLPPLPKEGPRNRLALARWLVDPAHPLTARVTVNRYWQMFFGTALVKTAEDFGAQGELPSHPLLLDWLATEFVQGGWDVKQLLRTIVTSATYRQSSRATPELLERDPENRLLARASRLRLPAETIRDTALAVSGLLDPTMGGPSVYPPQPRGLWEELAFGKEYSAQSYPASRREDIYRRSLYTFWKRTVPPPAMAAFDAPDREVCTIRRARTNTPLQALVLMNDPSFVEASRFLARRMLLEGGHERDAKIGFGFRLATARLPRPHELLLLEDALRAQRESFETDPQSASDLLAVGSSPPEADLPALEWAAWTVLAGVILNLDETITRE